MKTRRRLWVVIAIVLTAAVTVAFLALHRGEPEYHDRPLSHWLAELSGRPPHDPPVPEAEVALRAIGTNALPFLLRSLTAEDSRIKKVLIKFNESQTVIKLGLKPAETREEEVFAGYLALAEIAQPAVPDLVALMNGPDKRASSFVGMVLPYLGPAGLEASAKLLSSTNSAVRRSAVLNLAMPVFIEESQHRRVNFSEHFRQQAGDIVPKLVALLRDDDPNVAHAATFALGVFRMRPDEVIPVLTNLAANEAAPLSVRGSAIFAVGKFGKTAGHVVPLLHTFTNNASAGIRGAASNALWQIGGGASKNVDEK